MGPGNTQAVARAKHLARVRQELLTAVDEELADLAHEVARWEESLATIERQRQRVEEEEPDRAQLSQWRQELIQELIRAGILEEIQGCGTAES